MSWAVGVGPCDQEDVLDALKAERDKNDMGYSKEIKKQQDAVFKAVDLLLSNATFEGKKVSVNASGHVPGEEDDYRTTSVGINIHNQEPGANIEGADEEGEIAADYAESAE
jgi:hypothetical protein